uniref:Uncharacterized protein n=1 Tax=Anguilla anguilla TaxID=7936 RepID=A0A0E9RNA6_ANGAN
MLKGNETCNLLLIFWITNLITASSRTRRGMNLIAAWDGFSGLCEFVYTSTCSSRRAL